MTIRVATHADGERIIEMAVRFLETTIYGQVCRWTPAALADLVDTALTHGVVFVAECPRFGALWTPPEPEPRQLVGMIALVAARHPLDGSTYGDELAWWVEPEYRNSTAAYRLLGAAEDWAHVNQLSVLKLSAPAGSTIGTAYERRGYHPLETVYQKPFCESEDRMAPNTSQGQGGDHKKHVKDNVKKARSPRGKFLAFAEGILDNAKAMLDRDATPDEQRQAIASLRGELDEAANDIFGGNK